MTEPHEGAFSPESMDSITEIMAPMVLPCRWSSDEFNQRIDEILLKLKDFLPYKVCLPVSLNPIPWEEVYAWCREQAGAFLYDTIYSDCGTNDRVEVRANGAWYSVGATWYFRDPAVAVAFKLRWY